MAVKKKSRSVLVWILMGFLMLGLGGYGVTEIASGGLSGVATVGQTKIDAKDYIRNLRSQLNEIRTQFGRNVTMTEAREMGLPLMVQQQMITAATLEEEARVLGVSVSDETVAHLLLGIPAFQGLSGQFDRAVYGDLLRNRDMTEAGFEHDLRVGEATQIIQNAVVRGIDAPRPLVDRSTGWILRSRDISWIELVAADLPEPVALPDEDALRVWHEGNADRFTAPEIRHFTVAWLSPDMLQGSVQLDEKALRDVYEDHIDEYQQPERRLIERLIYPSMEEADSARAKVDAGASFAELAAARGLSLADADLGEVSEAQLGDAGPEVFAATDNGIIGPIETELGPALFSINAILDPIDISFEEAAEDLRAEAAADQARRDIERHAEAITDLVAGGAALEDLAAAADMKIERLDWHKDMVAEPGMVAAYPAFREQAEIAQENDFPKVYELEDGGIFALRLDSVTEPALIPFEDARPDVEKDWAAEETRRRLLALAETRREEAMASPGGVADITRTDDGDDTADGDAAARTATPDVHVVTGLMRDGFIEGAPAALITQAFAIETPGETEIVDADSRVILVTLDAIHNPDMDSDEAEATRQSVSARLQQSIAIDLFDSYLQAAMRAHGLKIDANALANAETLVN